MHIAWSAAIILRSTPSGLQVELSPTKEVKPVFTKEPTKYAETFMIEKTVGTGNVRGDAERTCNLVFEELKREFPNVVDLSDLVSSLSHSLEGCWQGLIAESNEIVAEKPFFNAKGDFLLDLRVGAPRGKRALNGNRSLRLAGERHTRPGY